jgi:hypothetical protein
MPSHRYCDGVPRRSFLKAGALLGGLDLASYLRLAAAGEVERPKATSAIFVNLGGGPSHLDTFDMKPQAPDEFRGEFKPIATSVPGIEICEHLPKLAGCAERYAILRGVSHNVAAHDLGSQYLNTGNRPLPSLQFPGFGAVVNKELPAQPDLPSFVAVPNTPQRPGYLGVRYAALETNAVPRPGRPFNVRGVTLGRDLTLAQVDRRQRLLADLDTAFRDFEADRGLLSGLDEFSQRAYAMISSSRARDAFDVTKESASVARQFGEHAFGQSCLLATRLVAAGVKLVSVNFAGWDTHGDNFKALKSGKLAQLDDGLSALFAALADRGLLDSTIVMVTGEFGRTPKINRRAGRDHWPRAMFVLMSGGGVRGGQVLGQSDERAMGPAHEPITPEQVAASFYHALGIDHRKEYRTVTGRPVMIVRDGGLIEGLFA